MRKSRLYRCKDGADYKVTSSEDTLTLSYPTNSRYWTPEFRGNTVASFFDHGDGVVINIGKDRAITLDYSELYELRLLLKLSKRL